MGGEHFTIVEFKFINAKIFRGLFRLNEFYSTDCVKLQQALLIDSFDRILAKPRDLSHLFVCISAEGKKVSCILTKFFRYAIAQCLKWNGLRFGCPTSGTLELVVRKHQTAQVSANAQMSQSNSRVTVDMHPRSTSTGTFFLRDIEKTVEAEDVTSGLCSFLSCGCIMEPM